MNKLQNFLKGLIKENPVLVLVLGTCPTLAISTSVIAAFGMGIAATAVLILSNMAISAIRKIVPDPVRIPCYIVVIAGFVTVVELVMEVVPTQVTLVPDAHDAITSNAGWNTVKYRDYLRSRADLFHSRGIRVSIFVNPDVEMVRGAAECAADRVELYTEGYASAYPSNPEAAVRDYVAAAEEARRLGLGLNAGHDLNLDNLRYFISRIPFTDEVSIGHALISDALYYGLERTVAMYLDRVKG